MFLIARPNPRRRALLLIVCLAALGAIGAAAHYVYRVAQVSSGFTAKQLCSGVFVAGMTQDQVVADLRAYRNPALDWVHGVVDRESRLASASFYGLAARTAVFRKPFGCTLAIGASVEALQQAALPAPRASAPLDTLAPWPEGDADPPPAQPALARVLDEAFAEVDAAKPRRTRAVVVVRDGRIVAERYAPGYDKRTRFPGWSVAKSVTGMLAGVLVGKGALSLHAPLGLREWREGTDARAAITLAQLLQMSSGLAFSEDYDDPLADVTRMLFDSGDSAGYALAKPLVAAPGTRWAYASGTTNVIALAIRRALHDEDTYLTLPWRALFDPIGASEAVMELDASDTFVGSSFMYATARDWARLGLLAAADGEWHGRRILPAGWMKFSVSPAPAAPEGEYAAHWWLKLDPNRGPTGRARQLPTDAYHAAGHAGQYVTVIPSQRTVVVRLGHSLAAGTWQQDAFAAQVLAALAAQ